jgi:transcriptional regulator with XRE-family HTH domain
MGQIKPEGDPSREEAPDAGGVPTEGSTRLGSYLRSLREGYGYTLRKVEERALAMGEAIDNSQLSRFEKGKAIPSFDKLRALARVFNVPVQNFSDVLDLEEYRDLGPATVDYAELIRLGGELRARGDHGASLVAYERALEAAQDEHDPARREEAVAEARWRMAQALRVLGKLYMSERELREILKQQRRLSPQTRLRALMQLAYLYRELGDLVLASVMARECLALAEAEGDRLVQAAMLNSLANVQHDEGDHAAALESYERALSLLAECEGHRELQSSVLTNLGGCLVSLRRDREGLATLREAHQKARQGGFRRIAALSLTRMAEAYVQAGDHDQARECLQQSDGLAGSPGDGYTDILFNNAFLRWTMAREEGNGTREKIAFGRLRHLRSMLQRRFPEVDQFDEHVARVSR